jgi:glycosyltransferase involved in cell wall biosynthesis
LSAHNELVVNTRALQRRMSGVERYTAELLGHLQKPLRCESPRRAPTGWAGHLWEQVGLPARLKPGELLWSPANTGPLMVENQVLTLHDTIVLEHPGWYRPIFACWYRWLLPRLIRQVQQVLTVSEYSRRRIQAVLSLPSERIRVIPGGVNLERFQPAQVDQIDRLRRMYRLPENYLLFIGTREPRKNLARLLQAWALIQPEYPQSMLVVAGEQNANFAAGDQHTGLLGVLYTGYIPEPYLPALYSGARLFLLPSLTEGFGLPALEAMACGTPVLAADAGALPEVVGDAGRLINPLTVPDWAKEMRDMLNTPDRVQEYRRRGLERAQCFPWKNAAAQVRQVLEEIRQGVLP